MPLHPVPIIIGGTLALIGSGIAFKKVSFSLLLSSSLAKPYSSSTTHILPHCSRRTLLSSSIITETLTNPLPSPSRQREGQRPAPITTPQACGGGADPQSHLKTNMSCVSLCSTTTQFASLEGKTA